MSGLARCKGCEQVSALETPDDLRVWFRDHESCWDHEDEAMRYELERMGDDDLA